MKNGKLNGKVALVTGGTSGIGKATAIAFARAGAKVVLTGRREKEGAQVVDEIKKLGGDAAFVRGDIAKDADVKAMIDFTVEKFGRLDIAFNNAGVEWKGPLDQATEAEYRRIFDINVWGVLNSMRHEIPVMLKNGGGAIVNTSSVAGHVGLTAVAVYGFRRLPLEYGLYALASLALLWLRDTDNLSPLMSAARYSLVIFPCFMIGAVLLRSRLGIAAGFLAISAVIQTALFVYWVHWGFVG